GTTLWRKLALGAGVLALAAALSVGDTKEAHATCFASVDIGIGNCDANGSPDFTSPFNIAIGAFNGSGNGNIVLGSGGPLNDINIEIGNTWLGLANGSGNGNIVFDN